MLDLAERHLQEAGAELAKGVHVPGAKEPVLALFAAFGLQALRLQHPLGGGGHGVAGGDQANVAAEHPLEHRGDKRVVGAAQDQRVHLGVLQRRAVGARGVHDPLIEREAVLDDRGEVGCGHLRHLELAPLGLEGATVRAPLHRGRRGEHPDPAAVADRRRDLGLGVDHGQHLDPVLAGNLESHVTARRGRRVTRHHQELRAPVEQEAGTERDPGAEPVRGLGAVGKSGGVAEIQVALLRQRHEQLVEDGEPADPRVEDGDRQGRARLAHAGIVPPGGQRLGRR